MRKIILFAAILFFFSNSAYAEETDSLQSVNFLLLDDDTDNDGVLDVDEKPESRDTDEDGIPDYRDTDDDNDGVLTFDELPAENDLDADGIPDYLDPTNDIYPGYPTPLEIHEELAMSTSDSIRCERSITDNYSNLYITNRKEYRKICRSENKVFSDFIENELQVVVRICNPLKSETLNMMYNKSKVTTHSFDDNNCYDPNPGLISISGSGFNDKYLFPAQEANNFNCWTKSVSVHGCISNEGEYQYQLRKGSELIDIYSTTGCLTRDTIYTRSYDSEGRCMQTNIGFTDFYPAVDECRNYIDNLSNMDINRLLLEGSCHDWWDYTDGMGVRHECPY